MTGLRAKITIALLVLTLLVGVGAAAWLLWRMDRSYSQLEQQRSQADMRRLAKSMENHLDLTARLRREWAHWTEMSRFASGQGEPGFTDSELSATALADSGLSGMVVWDGDNRPLHETRIGDSPSAASLWPVVTADRLQNQPSRCAITLQQAQWWLTCRLGIRPTSGLGPALGTLFTLEPFSAATRHDLATQTGLSFELVDAALPPAGMAAPRIRTQWLGESAIQTEVGEEVLRLRWPVTDQRGSVAGHVLLIWPRQLTLQARQDLTTLLWQLLPLWLAGGLLVVWLLDRWVVARVRRLTGELHHINRSHLWDSTVSVDGKDELAELALETNALLDQVSLQFENLESIADTDALTSLANRRSFDETLARAVSAHARYGRPLCLVVLDVDHFKLYNDHYGHAEGDYALQTMGHCLKEQAKRPGDLPARVGGEEFAVVLEDTPVNGAVHWVSRVQQRLAELVIPHPLNSASDFLTFSAGVACAMPGDTPESLYKRADAALYRAKNDGRNRVVADDHPI